MVRGLNVLPILCEQNRCTACGSCFSSCKHYAISMEEDEEGFLHPLIDQEKCTGCLVCEKSCPIIESRKPIRNNLPDVYACWHKDNLVRMQSSSGGVFSVIAEYVLNERGFVWGAGYNDNLDLEYQFVDKIEDLDKLRRSKYVQCKVGNSFLEIEKQLKIRKTVLFVGTPCHVIGLYSYLKKDYTNLITLDFICHGVPSPKVFKTYLGWIEKRYDDKLTDFNFRDKRYGWDNGILTVGCFENKGEKVFLKKENSFFYGMLHDVFIRDCCYQCESNGLKRTADFTMADFWGIGKTQPFEHEKEKLKGISLLALNSIKSTTVFEEHLSKTILAEKRTLEEAYIGNFNYRFSTKKPLTHDLFFNDFKQAEKWEYLLKKYLTPSNTEKLKIFVKMNFGPTFTYKLKKILKL